MATLLRKFLMHPPRVHVIDLNEPGREDINGQCGRRVKRLLDTGNGNQYLYKFASELLLPQAIRNSALHTDDAEAADLILIQYCVMIWGMQGEKMMDIRPLLEKRPVLARRFQQNPARFLVVLSSDHGPCHNFNEHLTGRRLVKRWIDRSLENATLLMNDGSLVNKCYRPGKDVVIPPSTWIGNATFACSRPITDRKHFAFFAGAASSLIREYIINELGNEDWLFIPHDLQHEEYMCEMGNAVFCLAPRGRAAWSPRLVEALEAGCIPVIIADMNHEPFHDVLDYSTFTVQVHEDKLETLGEQLHSISSGQVARLHANGQRARAHFRYPPPARSGGVGGVDGVVLSARGDVNAQGGEAMDAAMTAVFSAWLRIQHSEG
ncbi:hypothetical protein PTSG_09607 [Salpingoeca rosetta]|uniref:Exostosin GT47 domain-containing protein n=1 Tax=Salpingoeca rosetta (strain ATCC 50818 / BSB-021) TaxID=946362 RepID=F2ULH5_SALR5|nr:uncharacterized protein PTSG_09607 [Salpingoeca rosetta]EGD77974.1 hypothetical protein PTSG_09607 [Salpingoeca rosetta]|eukprot:XP_004990036.1 hypothetical protein PTSG_09607 [Salpingoeca rosetta]